MKIQGTGLILKASGIYYAVSFNIKFISLYNDFIKYFLLIIASFYEYLDPLIFAY